MMMTSMNVFISWSGPASLAVAKALKEWLPTVIQAAEPWVSDVDIASGARWSPEVSKQLEAAKFGIICLTPGNMDAPWVLFEAGAISRVVGWKRTWYVHTCSG
jgi:hypothetical protein